ncbi:UNVERIFIED_CONTAM: hypothetical protein Slati_1150500 [Sesamum latifolium]|uniref:Zinc knuckle CX2CX4HX4C domain-containing protein n=1 Tax=Sesamum latifolium TaxID=2727402 RepID=A0AAW2XER7_9LAMI
MLAFGAYDMGGVEAELDRLNKAWRLNDDEEDPVLVPGGLWEAHVESHNLCLVGRLLSNRPYRHEALSTSLLSMLQPVKGMDVKQLDEGRILLGFEHIIDKQRAQEGCPWSFEKNILILKPIGELENPMHVALDDCDFFIHVHDLPLSMMNLGMATLIGNRISSFRDLESDDTGCSWGVTMRIRVSLNVHQPLKRTLKLRSPTGKELVVRFTYERLPNLYYLCGRLGHIDKYCEIRFEDGYRDVAADTPFGPWLRAPIPGGNQTQLTQTGKSSSYRGLNQQCPPARTGTAVFGDFRSPEVRSLRGVGQERQTYQQRPDTDGGGSVEEEVESTPPACIRGSIDRDTVMLGAEETAGLRTQPVAQLQGTGISKDGHGAATDGTVVESVRGRFQAAVGEVATQGVPMGLNLVNVPLQFTSQNLFLTRGSVGRGRKPGRGPWGCPRKRSHGALGLGPPWTVRKLKELIQLHKPGLVFLSETKCKARICAHAKELVNYNGIGVDSVGDFNEILEQYEKQGNIPRAQWQMQDFRNCLVDCDLYDLGVKGDIFTWCNRHETPNTVWARLDRACGNQGWIDLFPQTTITHETVACSDHSVIWIGLEEEDQTGKELTAMVMEEIEALPDTIDNLAERRQRKEIKKIKDENGIEVRHKEGIQRVVLDYFRSIFSSTNPTSEAVEEVLDCVEHRVTPAMNNSLSQPFTSEEVLHALKQMHLHKSPGPDEAFSGMIRKAERAGLIQGIAISRTVRLVSHLLFADDTLIFCQSSDEALQCIKGILLSFEQASGLKINLHKSAMVFSRNVNEEKQRDLAGILEVAVVAKHDKYLGLPTIAGRSKKELFDSIKDRVWHKVHSWSTKKLSQAGHAVLIKTVLQTIPTYAMSCFRLPDYFLKELQSTMADFFWHGGDVAKIHWKAWPKLCKSRKDGGLGFRRLKEHNITLLAKQAWRIAVNPENMLHNVLSHKYFLGSTFMEARIGARLSFTWRSVWSTRDLIAAGIRWRIGNGRAIHILGQPWLPRPTTFQLLHAPANLTADYKVAALITPADECNEALI